ncbi:unnamed protein product [Phytophthora fragariaefolia]|uniref:Unnamed protein product n=1 Tax=Phytophthora fragariaefolia TaxID=1490495 RepID=A0A9W6U5B9_9STRA|nr:unnamed protein product [Phytophthora fragariaefolia]
MSVRRQKPRAKAFPSEPPPNLKLMSNSERGKYYRRQRKLYGVQLESRVAELRDEIAALTVSRQVRHELAVSQRQTPLGAAAHVVSEYCALFSHGAPVRLAVDEQQASASLVAQATHAQRGFLSAVMKDNVRFGEFVGVELLLGQWERYSLYHAAIEWNMTSLNVVQLAEPRAGSGQATNKQLGPEEELEEGPLVVSITADLRVRFSRRTIEEVFPHLVGDEPLAQSLIGLEVTYPCVNHFHFDRAGRIEWYAPEVDFVGALMKALKRPELVARVMGHALIAKDHMIGNENDGRQLAEVEEVRPPGAVGGENPAESEDSLDGVPFSSIEDNHVAVVSDDELSPTSSPHQPNRLQLGYILDD